MLLQTNRAVRKIENVRDVINISGDVLDRVYVLSKLAEENETQVDVASALEAVKESALSAGDIDFEKFLDKDVEVEEVDGYYQESLDNLINIDFE